MKVRTRRRVGRKDIVRIGRYLLYDALSINGSIHRGMLATYPFTNLHDEGIFGLFEDDKVAKVISIIKSINENAERG
ncbi:MAG: hypothetical protein ACI9P5_004363 [Saprospiraceae bacterium]|jgi:hypothetical protein